jgi:hypothetical protein
MFYEQIQCVSLVRPQTSLFLVVDEHSPSIVVVEGTTGKGKVRYTPKGKTLAGVNYTVKDILPEIRGTPAGRS